jgi:hypothetical protein
VARDKAWFRDEGKREKFLTAIRNGASVSDASTVAGFNPVTVLGWLNDDEQIRLDIERAKELAPIVEASRAQDKPAARDGKTGAGRFRKLQEDAASLAPGMLGYLYAVDARLAARPGGHGHSPYHRWMLTAWYNSGKPVLLACEGRGAGKSDMQTGVVVTEGVFAPRLVPPGETHIWPYSSKDMNETNLKFGPLESALHAVGFGAGDLKIHRRKDGRSEIGFEDAAGNSIEVRCYPNTKDALRGPTLCGGTNDEEAYWRADKDLGTSTADDFLDAMAGAFRGDAKHKKLMRISSANEMSSTLMRDIEAGDTDLHFVARLGPFLDDAVAGFELVASRLADEGRHDDVRTIRQWAASLTEHSPWIPSWVGNPTHDVWGGFLRLRKRVAKWLRENGSKPSDGGEEGDYFDQQTIDQAVVAMPARSAVGMSPARFAAIDTGASKNPSALCIVERVVHDVAGERRYQFRPLVLKEWRRRAGGLPLDLRNVVLPEMAGIVQSMGCVMRWWSDGWSGHDVENVAALFGIQTVFISTSTVSRDQYEPLDAALAIDPCPVVLSGCANIELAVAQLRQVRRDNTGKAIVPKVGAEHGELGQVLVRALAHAGIGTMPPEKSAARFRGVESRYSAQRRAERGLRR